MKFHYAGKYSGNESTLPQREHPAGYVPFKEASDIKKLSLIANGFGIAIMAVLVFLAYMRAENLKSSSIGLMVGSLLVMASLVPHEFLHALCFKGDVYMYQALDKGLLFVVGTEDMSRLRFVMMSLCPNIVFGFVPYIAFMVFPNLTVLGALGAIAVGAGAGDYYNVFNCLTQVPRGAKVYMSGMHSFWYKP